MADKYLNFLNLPTGRQALFFFERSLIGLCSGVALEFLSPETAARLLITIYNYNQCSTILIKPKQKPPCCCWLLQPRAASAQSPNVVCSFIFWILAVLLLLKFHWLLLTFQEIRSCLEIVLIFCQKQLLALSNYLIVLMSK